MLRHCIGVAGWLFIAMLVRADDAHDLLTSVSEKYSSLDDYLLEGRESARLSYANCRVEIPFQIVMTKKLTDSSVTSVVSLTPTIRFLAPKLPKSCLDFLKKQNALASPGEWSQLSHIALGARTVRLLRPTILRLGPERKETIRCAVLEVSYDDYYQRLRHQTGPVRYWIDLQTGFVRRIDFTEDADRGSKAWTAIIEKISLGVPRPAWLSQESDFSNHPAPLGKPAPDFTLRFADSTDVHLASLKGKAVVLAFWASWCLACAEEIPSIEELQSETRESSVRVLGISNESASVVQKWLEQNHRSFRTLVDGEEVFRSFGIGPIPTLVVVNRDGVVSQYVVGFGSTRELRQIVMKLNND
jgi:peroxiredoxin